MAPEQDQQTTHDQTTDSIGTDFAADFAAFAGGPANEAATGDITDAAAQASTSGSDGGEAGAAGNDSGQGQQTSTEDPWATAPEPLKAAWQAAQGTIQDLTHRYNSTNGRLSALTRKLNEVTAAQQAATSGTKQDQAEAAQEAAQQAQNILDDPEFKAAQEEYPEVFKPLEKVVSALQAKADRLERELSTLSTERRDQNFTRQEEALASKHPDWRQATASAQFTQWYNNAPPYMRAAVERHGTNIVDAEEVAHILNTFKLDTGYGLQQQQQPRTATTAPASTTTQLSDKRQRQLASAVTPAGKGPGASSGAPDDFEAAFQHFTKQK